MKTKRFSTDEQSRLIMECRQSGLSDYQWCKVNDINPSTFYNWINRNRKRGITIPMSSDQVKKYQLLCRKWSRLIFMGSDQYIYSEILNVLSLHRT